MKKLIPVFFILFACTKAVEKPVDLVSTPVNTVIAPVQKDSIAVKFYTAVNTKGVDILVEETPYKVPFSFTQPLCSAQNFRSLYLEGGKSYKVTVSSSYIFIEIPAHCDSCYFVSIK